MSSPQIKNIVVIGAGFGGLRTVNLISKKLKALKLEDRYQITLIDQHYYHTYTPLLYEVATTSKETANLSELHALTTHPIDQLVSHLPITFIQSTVEKINLEEGKIYLDHHEPLKTDYLILAPGSEVNDFGIPGVKKYAQSLKSFVEAVKIRDTLWNLAMEREGTIDVVIGGGGSIGVELGAEFKIWCEQITKEFPRCRIRVQIIQAGANILPGFDPRFIRKVKKRLKYLGVELHEGEIVQEVDQSTVHLKSGIKIPYDIFIWNGGIKAASLLTMLPLKTEAKGRVEVFEALSCIPGAPDLKLAPRIYGVGDSICFTDPKTQKQAPAVARAALSQAKIVAWNIAEDIRLEQKKTTHPNYKKYEFMEYPYITPVGGKFAVAKIGPLIISGFFGWVLKGLVELNYLSSIMPLSRAVKIWLHGLRVFVQNERLG